MDSAFSGIFLMDTSEVLQPLKVAFPLSNLFLNEGQLLYNNGLISAKYQHESGIGMKVYISDRSSMESN